MKCNRVGFDSWVGVADNGSQLLTPSMKQIQDLVSALDGKKHTLVTLYIDPEAESLVIGGGNGGYVAYATTTDERFLTAYTQKPTGRVFRLVAGGQEGEYDEAMKLDIGQVWQIATNYAETGRLAEAFLWAEQ